MLIEEKVEVNTKNKDERMPLHFAARNGHLEVVKSLLQLYTTSAHPSPSITVKQSVAYDGQDAFGFTPLLSAIYGGHNDVVILLTNHGADTSLYADYGRNPSDWVSLNPVLYENLKDVLSGQLTSSTEQRASL